jgi:ribonuclease-3
VVTESGPDHQKTFTAVAQVGGEPYGEGNGRSKKEAEQEAAATAWRRLRGELPEDPAGEPPATGS